MRRGASQKSLHGKLGLMMSETAKSNLPTASLNQTRIDPDILSFLLSGILFHQSHPSSWHEELAPLAMDFQPYKSGLDLLVHCNSYLQLCSLNLPPSILLSCTPSICRSLAEAGSHNAFGLRSGSEDGEEYVGYAIYPSASYFNHSCNPNVRKGRKGRAWVFEAAREIAVGEECCITYLGGDERDLNVGQRRQRLRENWGFDCACVRCREEAVR